MLDHYILVGRRGELYVAVGNTHPPGYIAGYLKYVPTDKPTPWRGGDGTYYERVLRRYHPVDVRRGVSSISDPCHDTMLPVVHRSVINDILEPRQAMKRILRSPRDPVELGAATIYGVLGAHGAEPGALGVTGSVLAGIHNPRISDIDIVVYGVKPSYAVAETLENPPPPLSPFTPRHLAGWVERLMRQYPLPPETIKRLYSPIRRGLVGGREYSIQYNTGIPRAYGLCDTWRTLGVTRVSGNIEPTWSTLNYPAEAVIRDIAPIEGARPRGSRLLVLSYDSLYTASMYRGGRHVVEGLLQENTAGEQRILVGGAEHPGFIAPHPR